METCFKRTFLDVLFILLKNRSHNDAMGIATTAPWLLQKAPEESCAKILRSSPFNLRAFRTRSNSMFIDQFTKEVCYRTTISSSEVADVEKLL